MKSNTLTWNNRSDIRQLAVLLKKGGVVAGTSDTILGLLAPVTAQGFAKLNDIKQRDGKPYLILISDHSKVGSFVGLPLKEPVMRLIKRCWPGPLTLIFKATKGMPSYVVGEGITVALRVPDHDGLLVLLKHFDGLFSTSANKAGDFVPSDLSELNMDVAKKVDGLVTDSNFFLSLQPSTILDCSDENITVVREGAYSVVELEQITGETFLR